jgi:SM-20-related protein
MAPLEIDAVLDAARLEEIRHEMAAGRGDAATVLGAGQRIASSARKATHVTVSAAARVVVVAVLEQLEPRIESHFGRSLDGYEEPQFLRYGPGDYFVAHQDGNTPLVHDESRFRKVSVVIFLSAPEAYSGGSLMLHTEPPLTFAPLAGTLLAFPSETTHEVLPITDGERLSVVSWYRG